MEKPEVLTKDAAVRRSPEVSCSFLVEGVGAGHNCVISEVESSCSYPIMGLYLF